MNIANYLSKLLPQYPTTAQKSIVGHYSTRLREEGVYPIARVLTDIHKVILENLALGTSSPTHGLASDLWKECHDEIPWLLDFTGALSKVTCKDGGHQTLADWQDFLDRNSQTCAFDGADFCTIIPDCLRSYVRRHLGSVPSTVFGRHGPGATSEGLYGWDKWLALTSASKRHNYCRLVDVPKDISKRRIIAMEPVHKQFVQQGLARYIRSTPLFRTFANLESNTRHVGLACRDSYVTVDFKDASDHIPKSVLEDLLPSSWFKTLMTWSTGYAKLAGSDDLIRLGMCATMGNGFCFELETLVFGLLWVASQGPRTHDDCHRYLSMISVYGDDVVVPEWGLSAYQALCSRIGMIMNPRKTCLTPRFKETVGYWICGGRAVRRFLPTLPITFPSDTLDCATLDVDDSEVLDLSVRAHVAGYDALAHDLIVEREYQCRWSKKLHRLEVRLPKSIGVERPNSVAEETRYAAYWLSGITQQSHEEIPMQKRKVYQWEPLSPQGFSTLALVGPSQA